MYFKDIRISVFMDADFCWRINNGAALESWRPDFRLLLSSKMRTLFHHCYKPWALGTEYTFKLRNFSRWMNKLKRVMWGTDWSTSNSHTLIKTCLKIWLTKCLSAIFYATELSKPFSISAPFRGTNPIMHFLFCFNSRIKMFICKVDCFYSFIICEMMQSPTSI